jgi:hypothetical protein
MDPRRIEKQPFGFLGSRALPEPTTVRRRGHNGAAPTRLPDVNAPPVAKQPPAEPQASAEEKGEE